ncbi:MAG: VanZ family protein [Clostridia bacterium]|nr:VanZ family protein [Clostridia bacterium]
MIRELNVLLKLCLQALPVWAVLRGGWLLLCRPRLRPAREAVMALFAVFMAGVLCMALDGKWAAPGDMLDMAVKRLQSMDRIRLRPFQTIGPQLRALPGVTAAVQLLGNILLFVPWGFCLPLLWPRFRRTLRMAGMALLLTCSIEFTQLFIDRFVEVDDVLLNFLGAMGGAGLWWLIQRCWSGMDRYLL